MNAIEYILRDQARDDHGRFAASDDPHGPGGPWASGQSGQLPHWTQRSYGAVVHDGKGSILLRAPMHEFDGYAWTFPKGKLDSADEAPHVAAHREVLEETGHDVTMTGVVPGAHQGGTGMSYFYLAESKEQVQAPDAETFRTRWATPDKAAELISRSTNVLGRKRDLGVLSAAAPLVAAGRKGLRHKEQARDDHGRWVSVGGATVSQSNGHGAAGQTVERPTLEQGTAVATRLLEENKGSWTHGHDEMSSALTYEQPGHRVLLQKDGRPVAAVHYHTEGPTSPLFVNHLGSTGEVKHAGTAALRVALAHARQLGRSVTLDAYPSALSFYDKLGFKKGEEETQRVLSKQGVVKALALIDSKLQAKALMGDDSEPWTRGAKEFDESQHPRGSDGRFGANDSIRLATGHKLVRNEADSSATKASFEVHKLTGGKVGYVDFEKRSNGSARVGEHNLKGALLTHVIDAGAREFGRVTSDSHMNLTDEEHAAWQAHPNVDAEAGRYSVAAPAAPADLPTHVTAAPPSSRDKVDGDAGTPKHDAWVATLTKDQKAGLEHWSLNGYTDIRSVQAGHVDVEALGKASLKLYDGYEQAMAKAPLIEPKTLYRGLYNLPKDFSVEVGSTVTMKADSSTSQSASAAKLFADKRTSADTTCVTFAIEGARGVDLTGLAHDIVKHEKEVVMRQGASFVVTDVKEEQGKTNEGATFRALRVRGRYVDVKPS